MKILSCQNLTKIFGKKTAVGGVSFELEPHKIYGLIGRNGAGKTTLLGILSGQNPMTGGEVAYDGGKIWENQKALNEICFSREINPISDNKKIKALLKTAEIMFPYWDKEYAKNLIGIFQLDMKKRLNQLSKGMLSAITIIIALASKAPMTFLDEPVSGLDVIMREKFYKLLVEEYVNSERTFVISTHIIDEAANVFEDVIILEEGKILRNENTEELLARHRMVHGRDEEIDEFCKKYKAIHTETLGRAKSVCIEIGDFAEFEKDIQNYNFDISKASLQKLFTQLLDIGEG
jgi:ABC-2 type transport system ATP-binding protein